MKARTISIGLALLLTFGIAVQAYADGGPNPGVPVGYKTIGPKVRGILIVGWKFSETVDLVDYGQVDAFLYIDGFLYEAVLKEDNPESDFLSTTPKNVTEYRFPQKIALNYSVPDNAEVRVLTEKDVAYFTVKPAVESLLMNVDLSYRHMIHCEVQLSFLILK